MKDRESRDLIEGVRESRWDFSRAIESHHGQPLLAYWYTTASGQRVRDLARLRAGSGRVVRIDLYYFSPDLLDEVCADLGLPCETNGYAAFETGWWNDQRAFAT